MLVSLNELKKYVNLKDISPEEIANKLTSAGIEVETIKKVSTATGLVIGQVLECQPHPDSDHLHITKVDIGSEILDIVCGAPNVRQGLKVIVAKVGAILPEVTIKESTIRGQKSCGMLCSLVELGIETKYLKENQIKGIEELPMDAVVGNENVLEYLGLDDVILDLSVLANRSDVYSLYNLSYELGALFDRKVSIPKFESKNEVDVSFDVKSETDKCKLFAAKIFKNITIKESPKWLKDFLRNEGIRSINNIVDIGNYAMLLTGQPINMYDLDKLPKHELIVRDDLTCNVKAMDDNTYEIIKNDLVVTSDNNVMCIAGIMTCENCEVGENTKNIVVESANFYGAQIRRTSSRLGLISDSSQRFVKGINPNNTDNVMNLICYLIAELSSYDTVSKTIIYDKLNYKQKEIECSFDYINNRLGINIDNKQILDILTKLRFEVISKNEKSFKVLVPSYRIDINEEADLSEEIIRFIGVDSIESKLPLMVTTVGGRVGKGNNEKIINDFLLGVGLDRIISYSLLSKENISKFNLLNNNEGYNVLHPVTEDRKYLRTNLMYSMFETIIYNYNHQNKDFGLFEISQIDDTKNVSSHLSIGLFGNHYYQDKFNKIACSYYDLKGYLDNIFSLFNISFNRVKYLRLEENDFLHPGRSAKVLLDGKPFAVLGEIHPLLKDEYHLNKENLVMLEADLSVLFETKSSSLHFQEISKFPSLSRDYAFIIDKKYNYQDIKTDIKKSSSLIKEIKLFDIFNGDILTKNKISIAINVSLEGDHTLTENEITNVDSLIREVLVKKYGASIRQ